MEELRMKKCLVCGKEFQPKKITKVCCSERCAQKKWRMSNGYQNEKENKKCIICGNEFKPIRESQLCCSETCRRKRNDEVKKKRYSEDVEKKRAKKAMPESNHDAIARIAIEARKLGMSYGQYVAKYMWEKDDEK